MNMESRIKEAVLSDDPHSLFIALGAVFSLGMLAGTGFYGEEFKFWSYPYSYLGTAFTVSGHGNLPALMIFDLTMILCAFFLYKISLWYKQTHGDLVLKRIPALLGSLGALIMLFPCDTHNFYHSIGSTLFVFTLWVLLQFQLARIRLYFSKPLFAVLLILLEGSLLPYAFAHMAGNPVEYPLQKITVWGLVITMILMNFLFQKSSWKLADQKKYSPCPRT